LRTIIPLLAAGIAASATVAYAEPQSSSEPLKAELLQWQALPTGRDFARAFPIRAQVRNVEGAASLTCRVTLERTLSDCAVVSETPEGYDFGKAAIKLAAIFKLKQEQSDPRAAAGAEVLLRLKFNLPGHRHSDASANAAPREEPDPASSAT